MWYLKLKRETYKYIGREKRETNESEDSNDFKQPLHEYIISHFKLNHNM